jgi:hypothetical protein
MENSIVAFHVGRGGRFYNPGHLTFIGEKSIGDFTDSLYPNFENEQNFKNRLGFDKSFDGNKCILDCFTDEDFETLNTLYGITEEMLGDKVYRASNGELVGLTQKDVESGVGCINIDNTYNTTYTTYLKDCSEVELQTIWDSKKERGYFCSDELYDEVQKIMLESYGIEL